MDEARVRRVIAEMSNVLFGSEYEAAFVPAILNWRAELEQALTASSEPDDAERLTMRCPDCGRVVYAVPGQHTLPGGPPDCPGSHIPNSPPDDADEPITADRNSSLSRYTLATCGGTVYMQIHPEGEWVRYEALGVPLTKAE